MSKGESGGGFLAKMARLVRQPAEVSAQGGASAASEDAAQDQQALKAAIDRKRRNDKVRRREFDFLRDVLSHKRAQQMGLDQGGAADLSSSLSSDQDSTKAQTIEKIARIEAQMSQHWLHRPGVAEGETVGLKIGAPLTAKGKLEGGVTLPTHLQVRAVSKAATLPIDLVGEDVVELPPPPSQNGDPLPQALGDAAVWFAKGDDVAAERSLRALMAQDVGGPIGQSAWLALLDLCHAQGNVTRFEDLAVEFADRFHCTAPRWPTPAPLAAQAPPVEAAPSVVWRCPALLDVAAVQQLQQSVTGGAGPFWLDWSELVSAELPAADALLALVQQWVQQAVVFRFRGGGVLRRRLKASTPSGRRENEALWWHLRLALLRLMGRFEEFDLAALDFCVTYGVLPPNWEAPVCVCEPTDVLPELAPAAAPEQALRSGDPSLSLEWPPMVAAAQLEPAPPDGPVLSGTWQGDLAPALAPLQQALATHARDQLFAIDCQQLKRMDFVAASALMQWLLGVLGQGFRLELRHVSRLLAAFFHVVGIDDVVTVRLRQY